MTPAHYLHAIYCDDLREEVTGKSLLVGVYRGELLAEALPVLLPRLCILAYYAFPPDDPDLAPSRCAVWLGETEVFSVDLTQPTDAPKPDPRQTMALFELTLAPLQLSEPCVMNVRVQTAGGSVVTSNRLEVRTLSDEERERVLNNRKRTIQAAPPAPPATH